jgi:voltage-gated potassium channel
LRGKHPEVLQLLIPWPTMRRLVAQLTVASLLLLACGVVYWQVEPNTPTLGDGVWLAFITAATVGYGDIVPSTPAAKLFSGVVVLLGFGVLSLVTAAIAATFVESRERQIEREILHDLHQQIGALRADVAALRERLDHGAPKR